jgi:hypothetical protein
MTETQTATNEATAPRKSFLDMQRDAALEQVRQQSDERQRVRDLVIGKRRHESLGDLVRLGDDYVAEIIRGDDITWATVLSGQPDSWRHLTQEQAILHLIAKRYDSNPNSNINAAFYAGRVLGLPEGGE